MDLSSTNNKPTLATTSANILKGSNTSKNSQHHTLTIMGKILWRTAFLTTILLGTTFSFRPKEAILKILQKLVLNQKNSVFWEIYHSCDTKQNEKYPCIWYYCFTIGTIIWNLNVKKAHTEFGETCHAVLHCV